MLTLQKDKEGWSDLDKMYYLVYNLYLKLSNVWTLNESGIKTWERPKLSTNQSLQWQNVTMSIHNLKGGKKKPN